MIKIYNSISNDFISINPKTLDIFINDTRLVGLNHIEIILLYSICNNNHSVLSYGEIETNIVHKYNPDIYDIVSYVRKQKHNICKSLKNIKKTFPRVIQTISKIGYKLDSNWSLVKDNNNSDKILSELYILIGNTINLSVNLDLVKTGDSEMLTILDTRNITDKISENLLIFSELSKNLLDSLNLNEYEYRYISILAILQEIKSYITFSRTGGDIKESIWKTCFYEELTLHYKKLLLMVNEK